MSDSDHRRIPKNVPRPSGMGVHSWQQEGKLRRLWMKFHNLPDEDRSTLTENEENRLKFFLWRHGGKPPEDDC